MKRQNYRYIKSSVFFISVLLLVACKTSASKEKKFDNHILFEVIVTNSHSNIEEQKNLIIQTPEKLQEIFNIINATRKPGIPIPDINFEKENVAFINTGETSTGGHSVAVTEIVETEDKIIIFYEGKGPKPGENATMVITTPFTMVKFSKQSKPVVFDWVLNKNQ